METDVVGQFNRLYYESQERTWGNTHWLGTPVLKFPSDLWIYQEILFERRPDVIVETGTSAGGSAHFLACVCDALGHGRVVTIDVKDAVRWAPQHPRITYLRGSSVAPEIIQAIHDSIAGRAMVILDSDHSREHVLAELRAYASLVKSGDYLIVEDTNGDGPREAVADFLAEDDSFAVDESREKFYLTQNPGGYLLSK